MPRILAVLLAVVASLACAGLPLTADFDDWSSVDLEERMAAEGWKVRRCADETSPELTYAECAAQREGQVALVGLATYDSYGDARWADDEPVEGLVSARDGKVVLQVEVHLPKEAHALADSAHAIDKIDQAAVEALLEAAGYEITECFGERQRRATFAACLGRDGDRWAMLSASRVGKGEGRGPWHRDMEAGLVLHERGPLSVEADVQHQGHAQAVLDQLIAPPPAPDAP